MPPETETVSGLSISDIAQATGLSVDALRWYEREGLMPPVPRNSAGRRVYTEREQSFIALISKLRRTGMPVAEMRKFVQLIELGARSHGRRIELLRRHRERVQEALAQTLSDLGAIEHKIDHYERLIEARLDCLEQPVSDAVHLEQRSPH